MLKDSTVVGLIRSHVTAFAKTHHFRIAIGNIGKDLESNWVVPVTTIDGLPSTLSANNYAGGLKQIEAMLKRERQVNVLFALVQPEPEEENEPEDKGLIQAA